MASLQKISKNTVLLFIGNPKSSGENDIMGKKQKSCKVGQRKYKETKERDARRKRKREQKEHEKRCWSYLQCNFSSRLPRDVTDNARINSSNSIDPSWKAIQGKTEWKQNDSTKLRIALCLMRSLLQFGWNMDEFISN